MFCFVATGTPEVKGNKVSFFTLLPNKIGQTTTSYLGKECLQIIYKLAKIIFITLCVNVLNVVKIKYVIQIKIFHSIFGSP